MTKHYAQIDENGKPHRFYLTKKELEPPWILVSQPITSSSMVYDPETKTFVEDAAQ